MPFFVVIVDHPEELTEDPARDGRIRWRSQTEFEEEHQARAFVAEIKEILKSLHLWLFLKRHYLFAVEYSDALVNRII